MHLFLHLTPTQVDQTTCMQCLAPTNLMLLIGLTCMYNMCISMKVAHRSSSLTEVLNSSVHSIRPWLSALVSSRVYPLHGILKLKVNLKGLTESLKMSCVNLCLPI